MNFDVNINHFTHKYLRFSINRAVKFWVQYPAFSLGKVICASGGMHPLTVKSPGSATARRRRPLRRPNYRRRSANYGRLPARR